MRRFVLTVVAVLAAIAGGAAGASVAAWGAWHTDAARLPSSAQSRAIAGSGSYVSQRDGALFAFDPPLDGTEDRVTVAILGGATYTAGGVELFKDAPATVPSLTALRDRLAGAGWRVSTVRNAEDVEGVKEFTATRDGLTVDAQTTGPFETGDDIQHPASLDIWIRRLSPPALLWAVPIGGAIGAVAGILLVLALFRAASRQRAFLVVAGAGLLLMLPATSTTVGQSFGAAFAPLPDDGVPIAPWLAVTIEVLRVPADLGVLLLIAALFTVPRWGRRRVSAPAVVEVAA